MKYARMLRNACVAVVVAVLACSVIVGAAYADDSEGYDGSFGYEVVYGPTIVNPTQQKYGIIVWCDNKYDSALLALGYDIYTDSSITADVKAYLSNATTGGSFYEFANEFSDSIPDQGYTTYSINFGSAIRTTNTIYGSGYVWWAAYTEQLYKSAKQRVEDVINGDVDGGGNTTPLPDDGTNVVLTFVPFDAITLNYNNYPNFVYWNNANEYCYNISGVRYYNAANAVALNSGNVAQSFGVSLDKGVYNSIMQFANSVGWSDAVILAHYKRTSSDTSREIRFRLFHGDDLSKHYDPNGNFVCYNYPRGSQYYEITDYVVSITWPSSLGDMPNSIKLGSKTISPGNVSTNWESHGLFYDGGFATALFNVDGMIGDEPTVPPTNWPEPDPPITTEPPEVPEPQPPSASTQPDISIQFPSITFPSITLSPDFTWVTADIDAILRALNSHCQHIQHAIHDGFEDYFEDWEIVVNRNFGRVIQAIQTNFGWFWDNLNDEFDYLYDYLYDLFHWLARQFDFNGGSGYNDDTVVSWLKKIYSKLGSGPVNTRPVDPVADPFDFGEWLNQLMQNFVLGLLSLGHDVLANLTEAARQLITKFPFSIPWDIAAIISALAADPVTPVIVVPAYTVTGSGLTQAGSYRIDLAQYDSVMVGVRAMETVVFGIYLMFKTDFFLGIMKLSGGKE